MRLQSVLFKGSITIKNVRREGNELVLDTDPTDSVPGSLYVTPKDVISTIRLFLNLTVIGYLLLLPLYYMKWQKHQQDTENAPDAWW